MGHSLHLADGPCGSGRRTALPPLAGFSAFASRELDHTRECIARTYCSHSLSITARDQQLDAWLNHAPLKKLGIAAMAYGADVAIDAIQQENFLLLMLPLAGRAEIDCGGLTVDSTPDRASLASARELRRMRWSDDCVQLVVQIDEAVLEEQAAVLMGRSLRAPLRFESGVMERRGHATWWHYAGLLIDELRTRDDRVTQSATVSHLESLLIVKLLETCPNNYSDRLQPQTCQILPRHVRKVEAFIEDNIDQPLTLEDLVAVSGVSARALFDGFQRFRGTSPMNFARTRRLHRVREDLLNARSGETVTSIASRWGFFQFGRFAGQYRRLFGELPSDTLRHG